MPRHPAAQRCRKWECTLLVLLGRDGSVPTALEHDVKSIILSIECGQPAGITVSPSVEPPLHRRVFSLVANSLLSQVRALVRLRLSVMHAMAKLSDHLRMTPTPR